MEAGGALPVISFARLQSDAHEIARLRQAGKEDGFFYLTEHGIPDALLRRCVAVGKTFFHLPPETKARWGKDAVSVWPPTTRGYIPLRGEMFDPALGPGCHEAFNFSCNTTQRCFNYALLSIEDTMMELQGEYLRLVPTLLHSLAAALDLAPDFFDSYFKLWLDLSGYGVSTRIPRDPVVDQGANYYPAGEGTIGKHTDSGIITLLAQEELGAASLRVLSRGRWLPVPPLPGAIVVNFGDMLQAWTGGAFVSTPHSVRHVLATDRLSLPFVLFPDIRAGRIHPVNGAPSFLGKEAMLANHAAVWEEGRGQGKVAQLPDDPEFSPKSP